MVVLNRMRDRKINGEMDEHAIDEDLLNIYILDYAQSWARKCYHDMKATPVGDWIDLALRIMKESILKIKSLNFSYSYILYVP